MNEIDFERLREDLIDYFGTAIDVSPLAIMELEEIESATHSDLIRITRENGFDLTEYII